MTLEVHLFTWMFGMAALWCIDQPGIPGGALTFFAVLAGLHLWLLQHTSDHQPRIAPRSVYP